MKRWMRFLGIMMAMLTVLMATGLPAKAAVQVEADKAFQQMLVQQRQVELAVADLQPYVVRLPNGTFTLPVSQPQLKKLGIASDTFQAVRDGMTATNKMILAGDLSSDTSGKVYLTKTGEYSLTANENRIDFFWWGIRWGLSNALVQQILGIITYGGGVATLVAAVLGAIPGAQIIAAVVWAFCGMLLMAAGLLVYWNARGRGVYIGTTTNGWLLWGRSQ